MLGSGRHRGSEGGRGSTPPPRFSVQWFTWGRGAGWLCSSETALGAVLCISAIPGEAGGLACASPGLGHSRGSIMQAPGHCHGGTGVSDGPAVSRPLPGGRPPSPTRATASHSPAFPCLFSVLVSLRATECPEAWAFLASVGLLRAGPCLILAHSLWDTGGPPGNNENGGRDHTANVPFAHL